MNIIIVGSGKVGFTLAEQLVLEEHDVTVVDTAEDTLRRAGDQLDIMTVRGNGVSAATLREAGAIEQDADIVLFLYREGYYNADTENPNLAECIIAKNRHGETGKVDLQWTPEFTTFTDMEWRREEY